MPEEIYKCVVCEGNVYPCTFTVKATGKSVVLPDICPFRVDSPKWKKVSE